MIAQHNLFMIYIAKYHSNRNVFYLKRLLQVSTVQLILFSLSVMRLDSLPRI